jgi:formamidopyrimidine-DNA glycosylase
VRTALLDQARIAGLGNIQVAESLWRAGVHPDTPCGQMSVAQCDRLLLAVRAQLTLALAETDPDHAPYLSDGDIDGGFAVYGGGDCPRCATPASKARKGGRTSWWCPTCQQPKPGA